jgi:hypothetical protein
LPLALDFGLSPSDFARLYATPLEEVQPGFLQDYDVLREAFINSA